MQFKIENTEVYGLEKSIKASGNPTRIIMETDEVGEKDLSRAFRLGQTRNGQGHDNFLKGILVQMNVTAPLYWWKQAQRYHWFDFISSQSTMYCLLKFDIPTQCVPETNPEIVAIIEKLVEQYQALAEDDPKRKEKWRELVASLPSGFCLGATMTTNYQQLKTMYFQRRGHKLKEWADFAKWCESLPHFLNLVDYYKVLRKEAI